jgi:hypothetical protein
VLALRDGVARDAVVPEIHNASPHAETYPAITTLFRTFALDTGFGKRSLHLPRELLGETPFEKVCKPMELMVKDCDQRNKSKWYTSGVQGNRCARQLLTDPRS